MKKATVAIVGKHKSRSEERRVGKEWRKKINCL